MRAVGCEGIKSCARLLAGIAGAVLASCGDDPCAEDMAAVRECGREFRDGVCETSGGRCAVDCYARASCEELDQADMDRYAPWLERCFARCIDIFMCEDDAGEIDASFRCDGENDCVDGSDESGCAYFSCKNGQLIAEGDKCDEYRQCADGSDEADCGYFLCANSAQTITPTARCNGYSDCADGSDELRCGSFTCADQSQAIDETSRCDRVEDCADGSDERSCP